MDHINHNRSDNRIENLRECTRSQNFANRSPKIDKDTPKGVRKSRKRFSARIVKDGKEFHLGTFTTVGDAERAYLCAARRIYGDFASNGEIVQASRAR